MAELPPLKFEDELPPLKFEDELPPLKFEGELPPLNFDEPPSTPESLLRGAAQGLTFDMADNAQALAEAIKAKSSGDSRPLKEVYLEKLAPIEQQYEAARKAHPAAYTGAGLATGLAVPGVGWLKGGKTLASAVKAGATAGALTGAGSTSMADIGETAKGAVTGAALGAAAGTALHGTIKGISTIAGLAKRPERAAKVATDFNEQYEQVFAKVQARPYETFSNFTMARNGQDPLFMKYLLKDTPDVPRPKSPEYAEKFRDVFGQFNESKQQELFQQFVKNQQQKKAMRLMANRIKKQLGVAPEEALDGFMSWFRPASYSAYRVDEKAGTNFTKSMTDLIETENRWGTESSPWLAFARDLKARAEADPLYHQDPDAWNREFYKKFTKRDMNDELVHDAVNYFESARKHLNEKYGLNIQAANRPGEFYVPRTMMNMSDIRIKLDRGLERIQRDEMDPAERQMFDDALRVMSNKFGSDIDVSDLTQVRKFINEDMKIKGEGRPGYDIEASAAFSRDADIPPYLVERDVFKLMGNYITGNMKAGLYAKPLRELNAEIEKAEALGMDSTVKYFTSVRDKLTGSPSMWQSKIRQQASDWRLHGDRMIREGQQSGDKLSIALGTMQKAAPDIVPFMMSHMYKNLLALNPYAVIRQFAQVPTLGTADMAKSTGVAYASRVTGKALLNAIKDGGLKEVNQYLKANGLLKAGPPEDIMHRELYKGLTEVGLPRPILKALGGYEKATNAAMKLYSGADALNRYWSAKMADQITSDLFSSNEAIKAKAFKYIADMPPQLQETLRDLYKIGNTKELGRILRNYTVNKQQFSYTTSDLNTIGREFGSLFTAFTKFPVSIISDIEHEVYKHGKMGAVMPLTAKYLAPLAMLMTADYATKESDLRKNPLARLLIGERFTDLSPAFGVLLSPPPILSVPYKAGSAAIQGVASLAEKDIADMPEHIGKTAKKVIKESSPFIPYYGLYDYTTRRLERAGLKDKDKDK